MDKEKLDKIKNFDRNKIREIVEKFDIGAKPLSVRRSLVDALKETLEYAEIMKERHQKLDHFATHCEARSTEHEFMVMEADKLFEEIVKSDLQKPLSREIRDKIHVIRGRMMEERVNYRCPCGTCGGRRAQDRYLDAINKPASKD